MMFGTRSSGERDGFIHSILFVEPNESINHHHDESINRINRNALANIFA